MQYTIRLLQPILDPQERQRIAANAASQLGGSAEKLEQLIGRNAGSRIARTGSAQHADRVAGILRAAGLQVEIQPPESPDLVPQQDNVIASKPAVDSAPESTPMPALASLAASEGKATMIAPASSLPNHFESFEAGPLEVADVFAPPAFNSPIVNNAGSSSPAVHGSAVSEPVAVRKPARPKTMPVSEDPFAPPIMDDDLDPFSAPASVKSAPVKSAPVKSAPVNPASNSADPFAVPLTPAMVSTVTEDMQADPFAAYGGSAGNNVAQDDLPKQARRARDRVNRRSSVRTQMLVTMILPVLIVAVGVLAYLGYILPIVGARPMKTQAITTSFIVNSVIASTFEQFDAPDSRTKREQEMFVLLTRVPKLEFVVVSKEGRAPEIMTLGRNEAQFEQSLTSVMVSQGIKQTESAFEFSFGDKKYMVGATPMLITGGGTSAIGTVYAGVRNDGEFSDTLQAGIPVLVGLIIIFGLVLAISSGLTARLMRPIMTATEQATRISLGDLDRRIETTSNDEIGDLLSSLERMRISLKSMVTRLRRAQEQP
jgi:HAMP domain-containing protein